MNPYPRRIILVISTVVVCSIGGCGSSEESEQTLDSSIITETTMQDNIIAQSLVVEEATSSLNSSPIEGSFEFSTQKTVNIDLQFSNIVSSEKISIYAEMDPNSSTPIYLLEQGTLIQSESYQTTVSVASTLSTLIIVRNDDFATLAEVTIKNNGQLTHIFEE